MAAETRQFTLVHWLICLVASIPFKSGIEMSMMTTSGNRSVISFTAVLPSSASATTCMPMLWPSSIVDLTIIASSPSVAMSRTKDWSIFSSVTGSFLT